MQDSLFQGGEVLRAALICYQQDELTAVAPSLEDLERNTALSRVGVCGCVCVRVEKKGLWTIAHQYLHICSYAPLCSLAARQTDGASQAALQQAGEAPGG